MNTQIVAENGLVLAQLTANSGNALRDIVLGIVASLAVAILGALLLKAFGEQRHGQMIGIFLAGAVVVGSAVFPDQTMSVLGGLFSSVFGGGA